MKDKYKLLIILGVVIILLILLIVISFSSSNKTKDNKLTTVNINSTSTTNEVNTTTNEITTNSSEEVITTSTAVITTNSTVVNTTSTTKQKTTINTTQVVTTISSTTSTTSKKKVYTCPDGYDLNRDKCTITIAANDICPSGWYSYVGDLCINLNGTKTTPGENNTCPEGTGVMSTIGFGTPTVTYCYPTTTKYYSCNEGYTLDYNVCTRTINATLQ